MSKTKQTKKIALVGGYGSVGSLIAGILARELPSGSVLIAGLDIHMAQALADKLGNGASAITVNAFDPAGYRPLFAPELGVQTVISCVELPIASQLPQETLARGINYTELSATYALHQRLMKLQPIAKNSSSTAVVGVGLMPGLSNVMAFDAASQLDEVNGLSINILLGLGEAHGADAIRWTLRNIGASYDMAYHDQNKRVRAFTEPYRTTLLDESKPRTFYRFNFSDQHMLNKALPSAHVDSRMAFDSRTITRILGGAARLRLLSFVKEGAAPLFQKLVSSATVGSATYAVQVEATGLKKGRVVTKTILARGEVEAKVTANVAAYVGVQLFSGNLPVGIFPIEQAINAKALYAYLAGKGTKISERNI